MIYDVTNDFFLLRTKTIASQSSIMAAKMNTQIMSEEKLLKLMRPLPIYKGRPANATEVPRLNAVAVAGNIGKLRDINNKVSGTELCKQAMPKASA